MFTVHLIWKVAKSRIRNIFIMHPQNAPKILLKFDMKVKINIGIILQFINIVTGVILERTTGLIQVPLLLLLRSNKHVC